MFAFAVSAMLYRIALDPAPFFLKRCRKKNITLILSHVNEQPLQVMEKAGFVKKVSMKNICRNIDAAIERAEEIVSQPLPAKKEKKAEKKS